MLFRFMAAAAAALSLLAGSALAAPSLEETMAAANRGDPAAANRIGVWYEKGQNGLLQNREKAVEWYRKAAQGGSVLAMHNLGDCYLNSVGVAYSPAQAYAWYKACAEHGGAIGYVDFAGNMDTCIAIRIAYKKNGRVFVRSGAGIVADSDPEKEYQECLNKARASLKALEAAAEEA